MAKTKDAKSTLLQEYKAILTQKGGFIAIDGKSIDNITATQLKKQLKAEGSNLTVVKNTIFKIALQETNFPVDASVFEGQTGIISYDADPTLIAKMLKKLQKETELFSAKFGVIEGEYVDAERVMQLADIPSREVLLAKLLGSMVSPVSGFMNVVTGNVKGFVRVVQKLSEKAQA